MQIVIDIPERDYGEIVMAAEPRMYATLMQEAITNGTPVVIGTATWDYNNETCKYCGNNPKNGGSGVCHCKLATYKITQEKETEKC